MTLLANQGQPTIAQGGTDLENHDEVFVSLAQTEKTWKGGIHIWDSVDG